MYFMSSHVTFPTKMIEAIQIGTMIDYSLATDLVNVY